MDVTLNELTCKYEGKQERPHFALFKALTGNDIPRISENTETQLGRYKKDKNKTKFRWDDSDNLYENPNV